MTDLDQSIERFREVLKKIDPKTPPGPGPKIIKKGKTLYIVRR